MISAELLHKTILRNISMALDEDIGSNFMTDSGDITAQLIPETEQAHARILTRESMVLAGRPWVDALFAQLDPTVKVTWLAEEGQHLVANTVFLELSGSARSLLTGERAALNFIQTLSGVATRVAEHVQLLEGLPTKLLDTRKTLPGLRIAEKYAVTIGGGQNHRLGLFDVFLIKENHILASGGIQQAIDTARRIAPNKPVEVEVETFDELNLALDAGADIIMLDNFSNDDMRRAVIHTAGRSKLEASGNITHVNLRSVAETGVDYISMGTLTKDVKAIDLSMRLVK
jgi:nicotinate-nucleotide pyrophosphorylase (carboxylating)